MSDCIFCKIIDGELPAKIVYQDDDILVFHDIVPRAETHLLMLPKIHIESLNDINQEHEKLISKMMTLLPKIAKNMGLDTGFRTIINTGKGGGQIVFHLHIHLLGGNNLPNF